MKKLKETKNESGQVLVLAALLMTVLMCFAAFAVDIGMTTVVKSKLQNTADAAALAGAMEISDEDDAEETAVNYAVANDSKLSKDKTEADFDSGTVKVIANKGTKKVEVTCTKKINYTFAKILGFNDRTISATATAVNENYTSGVSGLRPWALTDKYKEMGGKNGKTWTGNWLDYSYTYGLEFTLKEGGGGGSNGYYGIVSFGSQGGDANTYKDNITYGYNGNVKINDYVNDANGNKNVKNVIENLMTQSGDTNSDGTDYSNAKKGNSRVVTVPKINSDLKVIGFAVIYIKSVDNQGYITANFLYDTTWSDADKEAHYDWGLNSNVRLTN